jgi:2-keto-4-pentenoate hydratase
MSYDPEPAAEALLLARQARRPAGPLPATIVPRTLEEGVAVQAALAKRMGAWPPGGFKIGATTKRMQEYLGLDGPDGGFMPKGGLHASGVTLPWSDFSGLGVECEIAVELGADLPAGPCGTDRAAAAVGKLFAGIELVENRYGPPPAGDLKAVGTPTLIADQIFHAGAVLGAPSANWRSLNLAAIPGRLLVDGVERGAGVGAELLGHPLNALAWLASSRVAAAFGGLRRSVPGDGGLRRAARGDGAADLSPRAAAFPRPRHNDWLTRPRHSGGKTARTDIRGDATPGRLQRTAHHVR